MGLRPHSGYKMMSLILREGENDFKQWPVWAVPCDSVPRRILDNTLVAGRTLVDQRPLKRKRDSVRLPHPHSKHPPTVE